MARARAVDPVIQTLAEALNAAPRPTLVWGEGLGGLAGLLAEPEAVRYLTDDLRLARALGVAPAIAPRGERLARIVVRLPRAKAALARRLDFAVARLAPRGELWVVGHQRDGVRGAAAALGRFGAPVQERRLKRRCRVLGVVVEAPPEVPSLGDYESERVVATAGGPLTVVSYPGVFAHGRLDTGTARLLDVLGAATPGWRRALDLGCGSGVLGAWLARERPASHVDLLDTSALGCEAARRTLSVNGLEADVRLAEVDDLPANHYDLVVSNPPRHRGREHDHELTAEVIAGAARRLSSGGLLLCVANHNRKVTAALASSFREVEVRHQDAAYRVWAATR